MLKLDKRITSIIGSIPLVGWCVKNLYRKYTKFKPGSVYWRYIIKARKINKAIQKLSLSIAGKNYSLEIVNCKKVIINLSYGIRFFWTPKDYMSLQGMPITGTYEPGCLFFISKMIKNGDVAIDAGGNEGWYSCHFAKLVGETGRVHVFEPTDAIEKNKANLILNNFETKVTLNKIALSDAEGDSSLFIPKGLGTVFASFKPHTKNFYCDHDTISVKTQRLDDYVKLNNIDRIDFMKIDVEGAEYLVLKGAENVLSEYSPAIMLEIEKMHTKYFNYTPQELLSFLQSFGYKAYQFCENNFCSLKKVEIFTDTKNSNFIFAKSRDVLQKNGFTLV